MILLVGDSLISELLGEDCHTGLACCPPRLLLDVLDLVDVFLQILLRRADQLIGVLNGPCELPDVGLYVPSQDKNPCDLTLSLVSATPGRPVVDRPTEVKISTAIV